MGYLSRSKMRFQTLRLRVFESLGGWIQGGRAHYCLVYSRLAKSCNYYKSKVAILSCLWGHEEIGGLNY